MKRKILKYVNVGEELELIIELRAFKWKDNKQVICWYYIQKIKFIIHSEYFDANNIFLHLFIYNLKHKPNMVQDLSRKMNIALKEKRLEKSVKHQIHQI